MNYELLNKIIDYLEENLTNDIDTKKLAKKLGLNDFIMGRVFSIVTNISISEYIRKRRLSLAFEELKLTDNKIINIALKYGYDSHISFSRSFKKEFGITPSNLRKVKEDNYKLFPRIKFGSEFQSKNIINYEIKKINGFTIYGRSVNAKTFDDLHYKIRKLYNELRKDGTYEEFQKSGYYAITYYNNDPLAYLVGSRLKDNNLNTYNVKKGEYAIFEVGSKNQKNIIKTIKFINEIWYKSSKLEINDDPYIECYTKDNCYIYVPLDKRKYDIISANKEGLIY